MPRIPNDISRVFAAVQIPMLFLVLTAHNGFTPDTDDPLFLINETVKTLCQFTVPCFFLMSGYLVFAGISKFSATSYLSLLRRRFFSLFIPYMIWVCVPYIICRLHGLYFPAHPLHNPVEFFFSAGPAGFIQPSLLGYHFNIRDIPVGNYPLWYIRDLILLIIPTPAIFLFLKCLKKAMTPLCIIALLLNVGFGGFLATSIWSYLLGCSLAYNRSDLLAFCRRPAIVYPALLLWTLLGLAYINACFFYQPGLDIHSPLQIALLNCCIVCGGIAIFGLTARLVIRSDNGHRSAYLTLRLLLKLAPAAFFIYVTHEIWYFTILRHATDFFVTDPLWQQYVSYVVYNPLRITVQIVLFFLMSHLMPRTMALLTGGRASRVYAPAATAGAIPSKSASNASAASSAPDISGTQTQDDA